MAKAEAAVISPKASISANFFIVYLSGFIYFFEYCSLRGAKKRPLFVNPKLFKHFIALVQCRIGVKKCYAACLVHYDVVALGSSHLLYGGIYPVLNGLDQ